MLRAEYGEVTKLIVCVDSEGKRCTVYPVYASDDEDYINDCLESIKQTDETIWVCEHQIHTTYLAEDKEDRW